MKSRRSGRAGGPDHHDDQADGEIWVNETETVKELTIDRARW